MLDPNRVVTDIEAAAVNDAVEAVRQVIMRHPVCPGCAVSLLMYTLDAMLENGMIRHGSGDSDEPELPLTAHRH